MAMSPEPIRPARVSGALQTDPKVIVALDFADPTQAMHGPLDTAVERDGRRAIFTLPQFLGLEPFAMELANEFALARREDAHALRFRQKLL